MKPRQITLCLRVERHANDEWRLMEGYAKSIATNREWLDGEKQRVDRAAMTVNTLDAEGVEKHNAAVANLGQRVENHNVAVRDYSARKAKLDQLITGFNKACTLPYLEDDYQAVAREEAK